MNIPQLILQFILSKTISGSMLLPFHYPKPEEWQGYQSCFRYHGISGEDLTSTEAGKWQPGWYVIALNGLDDPFFVDLNEEEAGFPVYYAQPGAGVWVPLTVAEDITRFGTLLIGLEALKNDSKSSKQQHILLIQELANNAGNPFWKEVCEALIEEPYESEEETGISADPALWIHGQLILSHVGPNKIKIANYLRKIWDISPQEALTRLGQPELPLADGCLIRLQKHMNELQQLGATVTFKPVTT
jgi:hypothetical protein